MPQHPLVGIIMGSRSDLRIMSHAADLLTELDVPHEVRVVSAHRTPDWMFEYACGAEARGLEVIIAAAGGAAHLPGMVAAKTVLPVLGVPIPATALNGVDALLSIVQMPKGVPVGTLAIGEPGAVERRAARRVDRRRAASGGARAAARLARRAHRAKCSPTPISTSDALMPPILPPATIGILGGGQLGPHDGAGRALARLSRAGARSRCRLRGASGRRSRRRRAVRRRATARASSRASCDVVTLEIEQIAPAALEAARAHRAGAARRRRRSRIVQDRGRQKQWLARTGFPVGPYATSTSPTSSLEAAARRSGPRCS